jgi:hypothetical protein
VEERENAVSRKQGRDGESSFSFAHHLFLSLSLNPDQKTSNLSRQDPLDATIWAHDRASGGLVLASAGSTPLVHNVRITSAAAVSKILSAEAPEKAAAASSESGGTEAAAADASSSSFDPLAKLPTLDDAKCRERLERAVHAASTRAAKIGVGVSRRAQAAFDALDKTLPCAWGNGNGGNGGGDKSGEASSPSSSPSSSIFVLGEVVVKGPEYSSESASVIEGASAKASSQTLERVKMVLDAAKDELPPP